MVPSYNSWQVISSQIGAQWTERAPPAQQKVGSNGYKRNKKR